MIHPICRKGSSFETACKKFLFQLQKDDRVLATIYFKIKKPFQSSIIFGLKQGRFVKKHVCA